MPKTLPAPAPAPARLVVDDAFSSTPPSSPSSLASPSSPPSTPPTMVRNTSTPPPAPGRRSRRPRQPRHGVAAFQTFIKRYAKRIAATRTETAHLGLSSTGNTYIQHLVQKFFQANARRIVAFNEGPVKRRTVTVRDVRASLRLALPPAYASLLIDAGTAAIARYAESRAADRLALSNRNEDGDASESATSSGNDSETSSSDVALND